MTAPVRYYVAAGGIRAVVSLTPSQAALVDALRGKAPAPVPRPSREAWEALRAVGVPVVARGRGRALAGRVERLADWCRPSQRERAKTWEPF